MDLTQVNKIMARECGVFLYGMYDELWATPAGHQCLWTIEDARCREVIREKFLLETEKAGNDNNTWICKESNRAVFNRTQNIEDLFETEHSNFQTGKTIAESEINCIIAICKVLKNDNT